MRFHLPSYIQGNKKLFTIFGSIFAFLIVIIVLILVLPYILNFFTSFGYQDEISKNFSQEALGNREGPLKGIGGRISSIEDKEDTRLLTVQSDVGQIYFVVVDKSTLIQEIIRESGKNEIKTTTKPIGYKQIESGKRVYILTSKDLLKENQIQPHEIKVFEIYEN